MDTAPRFPRHPGLKRPGAAAMLLALGNGRLLLPILFPKAAERRPSHWTRCYAVSWIAAAKETREGEGAPGGRRIAVGKPLWRERLPTMPRRALPRIDSQAALAELARWITTFSSWGRSGAPRGRWASPASYLFSYLTIREVSEMPLVLSRADPSAVGKRRHLGAGLFSSRALWRCLVLEEACRRWYNGSRG